MSTISTEHFVYRFLSMKPRQNTQRLISDPAYRDCSVEAVERVTRDTNLYTVCLPPGTRMRIPIGHHVHVKHHVDSRLASNETL